MNSCYKYIFVLISFIMLIVLISFIVFIFLLYIIVLSRRTYLQEHFFNLFIVKIIIFQSPNTHTHKSFLFDELIFEIFRSSKRAYMPVLIQPIKSLFRDPQPHAFLHFFQFNKNRDFNLYQYIEAF